MNKLSNYGLTWIFFTTDREVIRTSELLPYQYWQESASFSWQKVSEDSNVSSLEGLLNKDIRARLDWTLAHDTHLTRFNLLLPGNEAQSPWKELQSHLEEGLVTPIDQIPQPWASTLVYTAVAPPGIRQSDLENILCDPQLLGPETISASHCDLTPFGWLWFLGQGKVDSKPGFPWGNAGLWSRKLTYVIPEDRRQAVDRVFFDPLTQGLTRIELYLHKGLHHSRQYESVRWKMEESRIDLQENMLNALQGVDFQQIHEEHEPLEEISARLLRFLTQKAQIEILLNSLRANRNAFVDHLGRVKLDCQVYQIQNDHLERQIEQLESDLQMAQVVSESTYTFQNIQRGIEASRMERAGMLMSAAATVLVGLAIFNSFLDIWSLAVVDTGLALPHPLVRLLISLATAIFLPLGTLWAVQRRKLHAILALSAGFLAISIAILSTIWVNLP
jgi:hypothetical protein